MFDRLRGYTAMAPKKEASIKKSPSGGTLPRLGPPFPSMPQGPTSPRPTPEMKPRMLRPSDDPFDPSTLEVRGWDGER